MFLENALKYGLSMFYRKDSGVEVTQLDIKVPRSEMKDGKVVLDKDGSPKQVLVKKDEAPDYITGEPEYVKCAFSHIKQKDGSLILVVNYHAKSGASAEDNAARAEERNAISKEVEKYLADPKNPKVSHVVFAGDFNESACKLKDNIDPKKKKEPKDFKVDKGRLEKIALDLVGCDPKIGTRLILESYDISSQLIAKARILGNFDLNQQVIKGDEEEDGYDTKTGALVCKVVAPCKNQAEYDERFTVIQQIIAGIKVPMKAIKTFAIDDTRGVDHSYATFVVNGLKMIVQPLIATSGERGFTDPSTIYRKELTPANREKQALMTRKLFEILLDEPQFYKGPELTEEAGWFWDAANRKDKIAFIKAAALEMDGYDVCLESDFLKARDEAQKKARLDVRKEVLEKAKKDAKRDKDILNSWEKHAGLVAPGMDAGTHQKRINEQRAVCAAKDKMVELVEMQLEREEFEFQLAKAANEFQRIFKGGDRQFGDKYRDLFDKADSAFKMAEQERDSGPSIHQIIAAEAELEQAFKKAYPLSVYTKPNLEQKIRLAQIEAFEMNRNYKPNMIYLDDVKSKFQQYSIRGQETFCQDEAIQTACKNWEQERDRQATLLATTPEDKKKLEELFSTLKKSILAHAVRNRHIEDERTYLKTKLNKWIKTLEYKDAVALKHVDELADPVETYILKGVKDVSKRKKFEPNEIYIEHITAAHPNCNYRICNKDPKKKPYEGSLTDVSDKAAQAAINSFNDQEKEIWKKFPKAQDKNERNILVQCILKITAKRGHTIAGLDAVVDKLVDIKERDKNKRMDALAVALNGQVAGGFLPPDKNPRGGQLELFEWMMGEGFDVILGTEDSIFTHDNRNVDLLNIMIKLEQQTFGKVAEVFVLGSMLGILVPVLAGITGPAILAMAAVSGLAHSAFFYHSRGLSAEQQAIRNKQDEVTIQTAEATVRDAKAARDAKAKNEKKGPGGAGGAVPKSMKAVPPSPVLAPQPPPVLTRLFDVRSEPQPNSSFSDPDEGVPSQFAPEDRRRRVVRTGQ